MPDTQGTGDNPSLFGIRLAAVCPALMVEMTGTAPVSTPFFDRPNYDHIRGKPQTSCEPVEELNLRLAAFRGYHRKGTRRVPAPTHEAHTQSCVDHP